MSFWCQESVLLIVQIRSNETAVWPVYGVKWVHFKMLLGMRYCLTYYLMKHQIDQKSKLKLPKKSVFIYQMESLNLQVLIPLEIKRHTIPHLKALTRSIDHWGRHGHSSTFKLHYTVLKSTILLHKSAKRRFHVTVAVYISFVTI